MKLLGNKLRSEKGFLLVSSIIITILAFVPYFMQVMTNSAITYFKNGDMHMGIFPMLLRIQQYFESGNMFGVDFTTFNGASEFFLRANISGYYIFNWLVILLSYVFSMSSAFVIFHMIHIFIYCYFSQKLCIRYFNLNKFLSLVVISSFLWVVLAETWTTQFFVIAALVMPLLYFSLTAIENNNLFTLMACSFFYVLVFTCGYVTLSVALVIINVIVVFGRTYVNNGLNIKKCIRIMCPPFIASIVCLGYYLQVLQYTTSVAHAETTMADAFYYKQGLKDILHIISRNFTVSEGTEQTTVVSIGIIWFIIVIALIKENVFNKMDRHNKWCFWFGISSYGLVWLISLGASTAIGVWFYSLVPILGSMHIPMRYLIILMPFFFIAMAIGMQHLTKAPKNKFYKICAIILLAIEVIYLIGVRFINFDNIISSSDGFLLEITFAIIILVGFYLIGTDKRKVLILWTSVLIIQAMGHYFTLNEVATRESVFAQRSIVYNDDLINNLDNYIDTLPSRELYRYIAYDKEESVPFQIPSNYAWFDYSKYNLSNYFGYNIALAIPNEYGKSFGWFSSPDWNYVISTRGDFIILDQDSLDENIDLFIKIIDWTVPAYGYGDGKRMIFKLNKFLPMLYADELTGEENSYIQDNSNNFDNGYFYSPDLETDDVLGFDTDGATYLKLKFEAETSSRLALLSYPNRYYKYYIDGKEIQPINYKMQTYLNVEESGKHEIVIKYCNPFANISIATLGVFYLLCLACFIMKIILWLKRKNEIEGNKNE